MLVRVTENENINMYKKGTLQREREGAPEEPFSPEEADFQRLETNIWEGEIPSFGDCFVEENPVDFEVSEVLHRGWENDHPPPSLTSLAVTDNFEDFVENAKFGDLGELSYEASGEANWVRAGGGGGRRAPGLWECQSEGGGLNSAGGLFLDSAGAPVPETTISNPRKVSLGAWLETAERVQASLTFRMTGKGKGRVRPWILCDDCNVAALALLRPFCFTQYRTSPGSFHSWLALRRIPGETDEELHERLTRIRKRLFLAIGKTLKANGGSWGSSRWPGGRNWKFRHRRADGTAPLIENVFRIEDMDHGGGARSRGTPSLRFLILSQFRTPPPLLL